MDAILQDRWILVVEDQSLVALDISDCLTKAGASVLSAATLQEGLSNQSQRTYAAYSQVGTSATRAFSAAQDFSIRPRHHSVATMSARRCS